MRKLATYEGIIENGRVRLASNVGIPEKTRVYVLVPDTENLSAPYVAGPHLADRTQVKDFEKRIIEDTTDANV
ncbi:MAG: hypothetical protein ND895_05005 [Pyrinomonadaceae bacterium]|nr:hypothetical protein [Pyrinomonadaceae bacterium]